MFRYTFFSILILFSQSIRGQYASGKMTPNKEKKAVTDFKDFSYSLSTTVNQRDLEEHIFTLADDQMQGRETGEEGNNLAAKYIQDELSRLRLPKVTDHGYYQPVAFTFTAFDQLTLHIGERKYKLLKDFIAYPQYSMSKEITAEEIVFLGYGIHDAAYSDYDIDVTDKVIMVYDGEPTDTNGVSYISGSSKPSKWTSDWRTKAAIAKERGAKMLIIISNDLKGLIGANRRSLVNRVTQLGNYRDVDQEGVNTLFLSSTVAQDILGTSASKIIAARDMIREGNKASMSQVISADIRSNFEVNRNVLTGQNILGYIEGTDLRDEVVVVSAHYDHVGTKGKEVYNGADDNASGSTAVLEIAEALVTAKMMKKGPRRSVLCLWMTGEEKGLLGSEYYASHPIWPLSKTIVDVNIDMVGRWGEEYQAMKEPYVYVIGSDRLSQELHDINEEINQKYSQLLLDYKYNDANDPNRFYFRSDHYNFAKQGIPAIFFFNGVHEDYHRLTDTPDKIDLEQLQIRTQHIFHLIWELANRTDRITVDKS